VKTINEHRSAIDLIDDQIAKLICERMAHSEQIGQIKKQTDQNVIDTVREAEIIHRLSLKIEQTSNKEAIEKVMRTIFETSRALQKSNLLESDLLTNNPLKNTPFKNNQNSEDNSIYNEAISSDYQQNTSQIKAGYSGIPGAFAESALVRYFGEPLKPYQNYSSFSKVCEAILKGEITYGILPVENTTTGAIKEVYDLIRENELYITGEVCLPVVHNLIGLPNAKLEALKEIYSHPQGLEQCGTFLNKLDSARQIPLKNTAFSIRYVSEQNDPTLAAIGDERAAGLYGLKVLTPAIQDSTFNTTRFVVLSKEPEVSEGADSTSIVLAARHKVGALHEILGSFAREQINLFRIESRPIPNRSWEYFIYLDAEGSIADEGVKRAIEAVQNQCQFSKFLGSYKKGVVA